MTSKVKGSSLAPNAAHDSVQIAAKTLVDSALRAATMPGHELASVKLTLENVGTIELNYSTAALTTWEILSTPRTGVARVAEAERLLKVGKVYPRGCSEFVCEVLGIPYELANDIMGSSAVSQGSRPPYANLTEGDVAGWVNPVGPGHVAIFIKNDDNRMFIDVKEPGAKPRAKNAYYNCELFESSRF